MASFAQRLALIPRHGRLELAVGDDWRVEEAANGGLVAAALAGALQAAASSPERPLRSLTVHYLRPILPGEAQIETRVERAGRRLTTVTARFLQGERPAALAIGALGSAIPAPLTMQELTMPEAPPPETVASRTATFGAPFGAYWDHRPTLGDLPYAGAPAALLGGWVRLCEPAPIDARVVAAMTDCYPPPILNRMRARIGLVPTVDLTIHFRRDLPLDGLRPEDYCFALFRTQTVADGYLEEDGVVWAPDGRLLAQSRQLAILG